MKALITGASSGIGRDIAIELANKGYDLILVARREDKLLELKNSLNVDVQVISLDLSKKENCYYLFKQTIEQDIDVLVNNAGFGYFGEFSEMDLTRLENMIDLNVTSLTILLRLYLNEFIKKNKGYILNVASAAAFTFGPLMSEYYATKTYVYKLVLSVNEELRRNKSKVKVSVLCPGPVKTEFDKDANVDFSASAQSSKYVASYAVKKMLKGKLVIIPSKKIALGKFFTRFVSERMLSRIGYSFQKKKGR